MVELRDGRSRSELIAHLVGLAEDDHRLVAGLDFAFSFPQAYCAERRWKTGREVWAAIDLEGEALLGRCEAPFWGRTGKRRPSHPAAYRRSELSVHGAKSVFQIGGAGAVGTGSLRGMPHLLELVEAGFSVWPFDDPKLPVVVEIYPRALTGPVNKSSMESRRSYLREHFPDQPAELLEAAAASEDAFDAAASALVMSRYAGSFIADLPAADEVDRIEGRIWLPPE
jgi:hypothetical protein